MVAKLDEVDDRNLDGDIDDLDSFLMHERTKFTSLYSLAYKHFLLSWLPSVANAMSTPIQHGECTIQLHSAYS